eukprot:gene7158-268_t
MAAAQLESDLSWSVKMDDGEGSEESVGADMRSTGSSDGGNSGDDSDSDGFCDDRGNCGSSKQRASGSTRASSSSTQSTPGSTGYTGGPGGNKAGSQQAAGSYPGGTTYLDPNQAHLDPVAGLYGADPESVDPLYIYPNCVYDSAGNAVVNGSSQCQVIVAGADMYSELLEGGVDGKYKMVGCYVGKPYYLRVSGPPGGSINYFTYLVDWEITLGTEPSMDHMVMYGDVGQVSPMNIVQWHLSASFSQAVKDSQPEGDEMYFVVPNMLVACEDDKERITQFEAANKEINEWIANSMAAGGGVQRQDTGDDTDTDDYNDDNDLIFNDWD